MCECAWSVHSSSVGVCSPLNVKKTNEKAATFVKIANRTSGGGVLYSNGMDREDDTSFGNMESYDRATRIATSEATESNVIHHHQH